MTHPLDIKTVQGRKKKGTPYLSSISFLGSKDSRWAGVRHMNGDHIVKKLQLQTIIVGNKG